MEYSDPLFNETFQLMDQVWSNLDTAEGRLIRWGKMQDLLSYQVERLDVYPLWKNVRQQRSKTNAVRQSIFGTPLKTRPDSFAASRPYFRVQNTLNSGEQRLVDWLGRTESEAEEEMAIPLEVGQPPPLQAWSVPTAPVQEEKKQVMKWWWPFGQKDYASEDESTGKRNATVTNGER